MNVLAIGASRNIGYHAVRRLLAKGATVTFLLRSASAFDNDEEMQRYVRADAAHLVQGDALNPDDVKRAWEAAQRSGAHRIDLVLFTVGGTPAFSLTKGAVVSPPDLCSRALLTVLSTIPASLRAADAQPRFIIVSSIGLSHASHAALPLAMKPLYSYLLRGPHVDKFAMEHVLAHCTGWTWDGKDGQPDRQILPENWQQEREGLPERGALKHAVVVRPALLTNGACKADTADAHEKVPYRVSDKELRNSYTVSREDVAHFFIEGLLPNWSQWEGKCVNVAY